MKKDYVITSPKEKMWGELIMWTILLYFGIALMVIFVAALVSSFYFIGFAVGSLGWLLISLCWWSLFETNYYQRTLLFRYDRKIIYDNCVIFVLENEAYKFGSIYKKFEGIPIIVHFNAFGKFLKVRPYEFYSLDQRWWWDDK